MPSSHTSLVGIRSTMGLTSRDGIVPLFLNRDVGGPMARTVADAVAILDVIAGSDPADPVTAASQDLRSPSYLMFLDREGLKGTRIGVVRQLFVGPDTDPAILKCLEAQENGRLLAQGLLRTMDENRLDALVYPSWNNPPRLIGDLNTPHGNNSARLSPPTGFPAITVPMGFAYDTFPAGLQILGR